MNHLEDDDESHFSIRSVPTAEERWEMASVADNLSPRSHFSPRHAGAQHGVNPYFKKKKDGDDDSTEGSDWSIEQAMYVSAQQGYKGYGTGPPAGPKRYKDAKELTDIMPDEAHVLHGKSPFRKFFSFVRLLITLAFGGGIVVAMCIAYRYEIQLLEDEYGRFVLGPYGVLLMCYLVIQAFFAMLEHYRADRSAPPEDYTKTSQQTIGIQISAFQEDPDYFRECLKGVMRLKYPKDKIKVLCCIDGNEANSVYMAEIFNQVMTEFGETPAFFRWDYNFHELPEGLDDSENGVASLNECIDQNQFVCLMQKWGGKREVMYTAFKALRDKVDYVQVCDSDTQLDPMATAELAWVLESQPHCGAVGGDVLIWNDGDSFISFLSSLRYWMAFNVERACQSYFGVVSCISGPIGLYRMSLLNQIVDLWSDQKFLGDVCTFGDDRHLTNRILQMGYSTKYTPRSFCRTETPAHYLRWLSQQIRWTKSYYREWLFNSMWWHKHNLWMTLEAVAAGFFPFFVIYTILNITWSGNLWGLMYLLIIIQLVGLVKGLFASLVRKNLIMIFMSLYSCLYVTSLLPAKIFAILTIRKRGWGTSGRKTLLTTYNALIPVTVWSAAIVGGVIYSAVLNDYAKEDEAWYLGMAAVAYAVFWIIMTLLWKCFVKKHHKTQADIISSSREGSKKSSGESISSEEGNKAAADIEAGSSVSSYKLNKKNSKEVIKGPQGPSGPRNLMVDTGSSDKKNGKDAIDVLEDLEGGGMARLALSPKYNLTSPSHSVPPSAMSPDSEFAPHSDFEGTRRTRSLLTEITGYATDVISNRSTSRPRQSGAAQPSNLLSPDQAASPQSAYSYDSFKKDLDEKGISPTSQKSEEAVQNWCGEC